MEDNNFPDPKLRNSGLNSKLHAQPWPSLKCFRKSIPRSSFTARSLTYHVTSTMGYFL